MCNKPIELREICITNGKQNLENTKYVALLQKKNPDNKKIKNIQSNLVFTRDF